MARPPEVPNPLLLCPYPDLPASATGVVSPPSLSFPRFCPHVLEKSSLSHGHTRPGSGALPSSASLFSPKGTGAGGEVP